MGPTYYENQSEVTFGAGLHDLGQAWVRLTQAWPTFKNTGAYPALDQHVP